MSRPMLGGVFLDEILTHAEMIVLAATLCGTRLHFPRLVTTKRRIARVIGIDGAKRLWDAFGEGPVVIPLLREERAVAYRTDGDSFAKIARKLGMTEKCVGVMFKRMRDATENGSNNLARRTPVLTY